MFLKACSNMKKLGGVEVAAEGVGVLGAEVGLDAAQGEVHNGEAAGLVLAGIKRRFSTMDGWRGGKARGE